MYTNCSPVEILFLLNFRSKRSKETPLPTPSYKYNDWMDDKRKIRYTPRDSNRGGKQIFYHFNVCYDVQQT